PVLPHYQQKRGKLTNIGNRQIQVCLNLRMSTCATDPEALNDASHQYHKTDLQVQVPLGQHIETRKGCMAPLVDVAEVEAPLDVIAEAEAAVEAFLDVTAEAEAAVGV
ncbi:hypothetical protein HDV05_005384, partial [Chytridiales sp. JEL 0842]